MSATTVFWAVTGYALLITVLDVISRRERQRLRHSMAKFLRQELNGLPELILIVEDLTRHMPEREEALQVARLTLIERQTEFRKILVKTESTKWWWD